MLAFVDESGDPGLLHKRGTSDLFIVTAVIFVAIEDAAACDKRIDQLRLECFGDDRTEFKFNKCCVDHRQRFLGCVCNFDFLYCAFALNKEKLSGPGFKFKESLYKFSSKLLFENAKRYLSRATVVIDGSGDREFRQQLQTYLKRKINTDVETISKVKIEASHTNNLLQLADMTCGAVARSFRADKEDRFKYRRMIARNEVSVTLWPKK
jgi:hypothetical protein